jgi:hypothetical protein
MHGAGEGGGLATVADATAQKEVAFKVKQTADGTIIVSVNPSLF